MASGVVIRKTPRRAGGAGKGRLPSSGSTITSSASLVSEQFIGSTTLFIEAIGSVDLRVPQPQRAIAGLDGELGCTLTLAWSAESAYLLPSYS